jgi:F0F1-type ATP synthase alpha subunit
MQAESFFNKTGAAKNLVIVASSSHDPVGEIWLTPYTAMTVAEYFRDKGRDVLLVLDDMTAHAKFYRELSLVARRFPGRESYPGDIFYVHSKLLERAGNFVIDGGEAAITCLPVVDTVQGDITGYIQTNLMSMTDGHLLFDRALFIEGRRPAIDPFRSVTRVGRQTQTILRRQIGRLLLTFLQSVEHLHGFASFEAELGERVTRELKKEKRNGDFVHIGNSQAILLGDGLFTWSQEILNLNTDFDQKIMQNVKIHFYEMFDEVGVGQMIDVDIATRHNVSKELIDEKIRLKTAGYSFIKPLQIGASLAGRETNEVEKFCKEFGLRMGIAFQTQDDLLDITSNEKQLQKTTSSDKSQNQHTYFTYFKSLEVGKEIIEKNFTQAKDLVRNLSIKEDAKKRFFDLIEIIQTRTF